MSIRLDCHAVVVGIDAYGGGKAPLQTAVTDAREVVKLLYEQHKYSKSPLDVGTAIAPLQYEEGAPGAALDCVSQVAPYVRMRR